VNLEDLHFFGLRFRYVILLFLVVLAFLAYIVRWIARVVEARTLAGLFNCPGCDSTDSSKSISKGLADSVFRAFGCLPYRCGACGERYFRAE